MGGARADPAVLAPAASAPHVLSSLACHPSRHDAPCLDSPAPLVHMPAPYSVKGGFADPSGACRVPGSPSHDGLTDCLLRIEFPPPHSFPAMAIGCARSPGENAQQDVTLRTHPTVSEPSRREAAPERRRENLVRISFSQPMGKAVGGSAPDAGHAGTRREWSASIEQLICLI